MIIYLVLCTFQVDIVSEINEIEACMGPGGIFGNIRGANKFLTMSTIVASRNIDLLSIEGADFYALLKVFFFFYVRFLCIQP